MSERIRVLVVDDSVVYRKLVSGILSELPMVDVVGTAASGSAALARVAELQPDLLTLDVEMPEMDGLEVLQELRRQGSDVGVLMVSAHTVRGGDLTIRALELGAFDFVTKPNLSALEENRAALSSSFKAILWAYATRHRVRGMLRDAQVTQAAPAPAPTLAPVRVPGGTEVLRRTAGTTLVLVGVSTGGPTALASVVPALPPDLPAPVIIVQHMPAVFTHSLASSLDAKSALRVKEAEDGEVATAGNVYIAPGGQHLRVVSSAAGSRILRITDDPPEQGCKPSVDYLFRSAAHLGPIGVLAVVMTGMGTDGTVGARLLKRTGARIVAQDEDSCVVFGMPKSVIAAGVVDKICPLGGIAAEICRAVRG